MMKPATPSQVRVVTFKINDRDVSARSDETILQVARENGIRIPSLCYVEGLSVWGACRLCLIELNGDSRLLAACSTRVEEGMEVLTDTDRLRRYRRMIVELLFAERNHVCAVCVSNGRCELQNLAQECGVDHVRVPYRTPCTTSTPRMTGSAWTTTAVCSARGACGRATKSRGPTRGTRWGAASTVR